MVENQQIADQRNKQEKIDEPIRMVLQEVDQNVSQNIFSQQVADNSQSLVDDTAKQDKRMLSKGNKDDDEREEDDPILYDYATQYIALPVDKVNQYLVSGNVTIQDIINDDQLDFGSKNLVEPNSEQPINKIYSRLD